MKRILIIGASSAIGSAIALQLATEEDTKFALVGRNEQKIIRIADMLRHAGAFETKAFAFNATDYASHKALLSEAIAAFDGIDIALISYGDLPNQRDCELNLEAARQTLEINLVSTVSILLTLADYFEERRKGLIVVISSVAGDLGRRKNYIYGAAKGGLSVFLEGLTARLRRSGVSVVNVKPGPIKTPMTEALPKNSLWVLPDDVAKDVSNAIKKRRPVVYSPWYWRYIMKALRVSPKRWVEKLDI